MNQNPKNILILDADHHLGAALSMVLSEAGHVVFTHARQDSRNVNFVCENISADLPNWNTVHGPFDHIVFGLRNTSESADSFESITYIEQDISITLGELKACVQLLSRRDDCQIWVLLQEDSMQYYLPLPSQPMRSRALMAAVKSLAKEVFCFGIKLNAIQIQPLEEQFESSIWKNAKEGLKAYALKFKPQKSIDVAQLIRSLIEIPKIPLAGMVVPVGVGFPEANV